MAVDSDNLHYLNMEKGFFISLSKALCITACCIVLTGCSKESADSVELQYIKNTPLPIGKKNLKVLAIGNSYTTDGTACIKHIIGGTSIKNEDYCVYILNHGGAALEYWDERITANAVDSLTLMAGSLKMPVVKGTMTELIAQDWDVIVMQQYSSYAPQFSTYVPYLYHLLSFCKANCTNEQISFAWQMVHAYSTKYYLNKGLAGEERWEAIANATKDVQEKVGIDIIIPTGTAIQNARNTSLHTPAELTRDYTHLCYGTGRHIAALAWVQTLFAPVFNISILDNTVNHPLANWELTSTAIIEDSSVPVTDENRSLCIDCAYKACQNPYSLSY